MSFLSPAADRSTLADAVLPRSVAGTALAVTAGAALVAALAQVEIPLWPVPVTGQTLGVLLVGASLGARRGAAALTVYLVAGLAGLPVFAGFSGGPHTVLAPSFGFLLGFVPAAAFVGWFAERRWDRHVGRNLIAAAGGTAIPFLVGVPYMALLLPRYDLPTDPASLLAFGVTPFLLGGAIKAVIAAVTLPALWRLTEPLAGRRGER